MALTDSLISAWELNEASGDAVDSHGTNTLTETSGTIGTGTGLVYSTARDFEVGDTEYFAIADNASVSAGDIDFTFEAWVKLESKDDNMMIVSKDNETSGNREYNFYYGVGADRFALELFSATDSGTVLTANTGGSPSLATWYHVIAKYDAAGNSMKIRVNNGTVDSTSKSTLQASGTAEFRIGGRQYTGAPSPFDGLIGPVRYWKKVTTDDEDTQLYNGGAGLPYADFDGGATFNAGWAYGATSGVLGTGVF